MNENKLWTFITIARDKETKLGLDLDLDLDLIPQYLQGIRNEILFLRPMTKGDKDSSGLSRVKGLCYLQPLPDVIFRLATKCPPLA